MEELWTGGGMIGSTMGLIGGALSAGGSILGGMMGKSGADAAAQASQQAAQQALAFQQSQAQSNRSDASPYMSLGQSSAGLLGALMGYGTLWNHGGQGATYNFETDPNAQTNAIAQLKSYINGTGPAVSDTFQTDPGYEFRLSEGSKALDRSAASRGMLLSGAQAKGLTDYNQNFASNEYGNWWNRTNQRYQNALSQLFQGAGLGSNSVNALNGVNSGLVQGGNNALMTGATNAGNFTSQGANDMASGIGSGINNALMAGYLFSGRGMGGGGSSYSPASSYAQPYGSARY
ncbi:MAG TPA: hypothetical protein VF501_06700 [Thiobacillus sp.]